MVLIVLSCILVPLSVVAVWAHNQVLDTDDYVADRRAARAQRGDRATRSRCGSRTRCSTTSTSRRSRRTCFRRAGRVPRRSAHDGAARLHPGRLTLRFFESEAVPEALGRSEPHRARAGGQGAHRRRHGHLDARTVTSCSTSRTLVVQVRSELSARGIGIFDNLPIGKLALRFELFDAEGLKSAQAGVRLLDKLAIVLPILAIVFAAAGIWLAGRPAQGAACAGASASRSRRSCSGSRCSLGRDALSRTRCPPTRTCRRRAPRSTSSCASCATRTGCCSRSGCIIALGAYLAGSSRVAAFVRGKTTGALDAVGDRADGRRLRLRRRRRRSSPATRTGCACSASSSRS